MQTSTPRGYSYLANLMRAPNSCPEREIALVAGPFRNPKHRGSVDAQKLARFRYFFIGISGPGEDFNGVIRAEVAAHIYCYLIVVCAISQNFQAPVHKDVGLSTHGAIFIFVISGAIDATQLVMTNRKRGQFS